MLTDEIHNENLWPACEHQLHHAVRRSALSSQGCRHIAVQSFPSFLRAFELSNFDVICKWRGKEFAEKCGEKYPTTHNLHFVYWEASSDHTRSKVEGCRYSEVVTWSGTAKRKNHSTHLFFILFFSYKVCLRSLPSSLSLFACLFVPCKNLKAKYLSPTLSTPTLPSPSSSHWSNVMFKRKRFYIQK